MNVSIELDKPRTIRFDLTAIKNLENAMGGKPLGEILNDLGRLGMNALCLALVHGLKHEDATLNANLVTKILSTYIEHGGTLDAVYAAVREALDKSGLFRTKEDQEGNARPELTVQ